MVPRLAAEGSSFRGAYLYYCHDKKAQTTARIAWTETVNMMTDRVEKAWKVMAYTAKSATQLKRAWGKKRAGDKVEKPVIAYSLAWHPEQTPDKPTMLEAAKQSIKALKLEGHEAFIVAHNDEQQPHVHVVINRIHPLTGLAANLHRSKRKLSDWARKFQKQEGTDYCPKREENYQKRKKNAITQYGDPAIIEAWQQSHCGQSFKDALKARNYDLARGRKRVVVVDPYGKTLNPVRMLPEVKTAEFNDRLRDIEPHALPTLEEIIAQRAIPQQQAEPESQQDQPHDESDESHPTTDPDLEKRQQAHDEHLFEKLTRQSERHFQEWDHAQKSSRKRIKNLRTELTDYYKLEKRQDAIESLHQKLDAPTIIPKFVRQLFRMDITVTAKLEKFQATQNRAKNRFDETLRKIEKDEGKSLQRLESRHAREHRQLSDRLEQGRPGHPEQNRLSLARYSGISIQLNNEGPQGRPARESERGYSGFPQFKSI